MECGGRGKSGRQTVSPLPERRESIEKWPASPSFPVLEGTGGSGEADVSAGGS